MSNNTLGKLQAIIVNVDGSKRVVYDGAEMPVTEAPLTPEDTLEVESAQYTSPAIPSSVLMRQARLVLLELGLLDSVESATKDMPSPSKDIAEIEWNYSPIVDRHKALVAVLVGKLGISESQLDELFIKASSL